MGKITLDRSGDLRTRIFYRFGVPIEGSADNRAPSPDWIVIPNTPGNDKLRKPGGDYYVRVEDIPDYNDRIIDEACQIDPSHMTRFIYRKTRGEIQGGGHTSHFIATVSGSFFGVSETFRSRLERVNVRGARLDPMEVTLNLSELKNLNVASLQFVGKASLRRRKFVDVPNRCPHCGQGKIMCEYCGLWNGYCKVCEKPMVIVKSMHAGKDDKRIPIEENLTRIIEGRTWDGSDLIQAHGAPFASKRFIDWLLRVHAAPFYAEPVWFCVDGMNDQQKRWFDELQKPFDT
jgi:hypothetical protein